MRKQFQKYGRFVDECVIKRGKYKINLINHLVVLYYKEGIVITLSF